MSILSNVQQPVAGSAAVDWPLVSVIIPVRDEAGYIEACLGHVVRQTYPADRLEIVVADGQSDDDTRARVDRCAARWPAYAIRLVDNPKRQRAAGLNLGLAQARGEVVVRLDARAVIPPDYVHRCVQTLLQSGADNVGGLVRPLGEVPSAKAIGLAMYHYFGMGNAQFRVGRHSGPVDTVYLGCFRRDVFDRVGLFDEGFINEDADLNYRIVQAGGVVYLDTAIQVFYCPRESLVDLWRLYVHYGRCRAAFALKHRRLTSWRQLMAPGLVAALAGLGALALAWPPARALWLLLTGVYAAAVVVAATDLARRQAEGRLWGRLLLVFPLMHLGWGLGFLAGCLSPRLRR